MTIMKKLAVTSLFILIFLLPSIAQVRIGVSVDPQVSWLSSDRKKVEGNGSIAGIAFGLNIDKHFTDRYAVYSGIFIESTGGYLKYNVDGFKIDSKDQKGYVISPGESMKYRLQYLTAPIGIKLKTNPVGYNTFYANIGLKPSILIKAKGFSGSGHAGGVAMDGEVLSSAMNSLNLGYQIGIGTEYSLGGSVALLFGITYNNGLTNTVNNSSLHINLNSFAFKVGAMF